MVQRQGEPPLVLRVYPGASEGECEVYEDDGESTGYRAGAHARTRAHYTRNATHLVLVIRAEESGAACQTLIITLRP
eukprot:4707207-Pyramimonas_sp.AAC.1